jgi:hypothetical protein
MPVRTAVEWLLWIYENNTAEAIGLNKSKIKRMKDDEAIIYCRNYLEAMVRKDGKRGILYQEKQMAHQLGLSI